MYIIYRQIVSIALIGLGLICIKKLRNMLLKICVYESKISIRRV